jgi:phosphoribosylamine-glycine ligase
LVVEDFGSFLVDLEAGKAREMQLREAYAFVLTLSVYPYPYEIPSVYLPGVPVEVPSLPSGANWWSAGVERVDGKVVTASGYPLVGYVSVWDDVASRAINRAYVVADEVEVSGKQFRNDGANLLEDLKRLQAMGIRGPYARRAA